MIEVKVRAQDVEKAEAQILLPLVRRSYTRTIRV